jgi:hypothetical protein
MIKSNLHVHVFPDVVIYCCILHNMILSGKDVDIDGLMLQLEVENVEEMRRGVTRQLTDQIDQVNRLDIGTTL